MKFGYCGINYKNANQDVRDKVSFTDSKKEKMLELLGEEGIYQSIVLSTCNRSEVFYFYDDDSKKNAAAGCFEMMFEGSCPEMNFEENAIEYFFRVTAGLESMVLGEDQILGQVREAFEFSKTMGYSKKELNRVVMDAIACARKIKNLYKISEIPLSVGYVGIKELNTECAIKDKRVLLIGSGQTAQLALKYLEEYSPSEIIICNRTKEKAIALIEGSSHSGNINIQTANLNERYDILKKCDIVVSATSSPHLVIEAEKCHLEKKVCMLDLASPRDIDRSLGNNHFCKLINLDKLGAIVEKNKNEREELSKKSAGIIKECVENIVSWLNITAVDGTIESLQKRCDDIVQDSFSYINRKLNLSEHEQLVIKRTLKASLKRLLREPIVELKGLENKEEQELFKETVERLFHI